MNKIFNWTFGSIFRTLGRIIAYIIIGIIAVMLFNAGGFKKPKISNILNDVLFMNVNAETFENGLGVITWYQDSGKTNAYTFDDIYYYSNEQSATNNGANPNLTRFYGNINVSNIRGGRFEAPFLLALPLVSTNWTTTNNQLDYCTQWDYRVLTTQENVLSWDCQKFDSNSITSNDHEYQTPTVNLAVYVIYNDGNITYCNIMNDRNTITCPVPNRSTTNNVEQIVISSYVRYGGNSSQTYKVGITNYFNTYSSDSNNIITNQNQNTQDIISNQESLTNQTIQNQNQNTQQQIESQMVCRNEIIDKEDIIVKGYLNANGEVTDNTSNTFGTTDYYEIISDVKIIKTDGPRYCLYDTNKIYIRCSTSTTLGNITIPNNAKYIRFSVNINNNIPQFELKTCQNGNQAMANTITDSNVSEANSSASGFFNDFSTTDNGGLSSIITAPLSAIQSLTSASCSPLVLPLPFVNENLTLPCMRTIYESNFGGFMTLYDVITIGIISYWILVRIFNLVKDFKNPDHDEIEVVDL